MPATASDCARRIVPRPPAGRNACTSGWRMEDLLRVANKGGSENEVPRRVGFAGVRGVLLACFLTAAGAAELPPGIEASDFAPRSPRTATTLFARVSAE